MTKMNTMSIVGYCLLLISGCQTHTNWRGEASVMAYVEILREYKEDTHLILDFKCHDEELRNIREKAFFEYQCGITNDAPVVCTQEHDMIHRYTLTPVERFSVHKIYKDDNYVNVVMSWTYSAVASGALTVVFFDKGNELVFLRIREANDEEIDGMLLM